MLNSERFLQNLGLCKRAGKIVSGDELLPAMANGKIHLMVLACDASERTRKQINDKCKTYRIPVVSALSRDEISHACGVVNRVALGISDEGLSKILQNCI